MARLVIPNNQMGDLMYNALTNTQNILNPAFGIVEIGKDDNIVIDGGLTFTKRYQDSLGDWETVTSNSFSATAQELDQKESVLMNITSTILLKQANYDKFHTGEKELPIVFQEQIAESSVQNIQKNLAASIKGAFLATDATAFKTDITGETVSYPTFDSIMDVKASAYPDKAEDMLKAIIVHADIYAVLAKDTASTWASNTIAGDIVKGGKILQIAGLNVIKNSTVAYKTGTGDTATYMSYLVGGGALTTDYQRKMVIATSEDIGTGGITSSIAATTSFFAGPKMASWKGSTTSVPTLTALATGSNWEWNEFDTQDVGVHELKSLKV